MHVNFTTLLAGFSKSSCCSVGHRPGLRRLAVQFLPSWSAVIVNVAPVACNLLLTPIHVFRLSALDDLWQAAVAGTWVRSCQDSECAIRRPQTWRMTQRALKGPSNGPDGERSCAGLHCCISRRVHSPARPCSGVRLVGCGKQYHAAVLGVRCSRTAARWWAVRLPVLPPAALHRRVVCLNTLPCCWAAAHIIH